MRVRAFSGVFSVGAGNKDYRIDSGLDIETSAEILSFLDYVERVCVHVHPSICLSVHPGDESGLGHKVGIWGI